MGYPLQLACLIAEGTDVRQERILDGLLVAAEWVWTGKIIFNEDVGSAHIPVALLVLPCEVEAKVLRCRATGSEHVEGPQIVVGGTQWER